MTVKSVPERVVVESAKDRSGNPAHHKIAFTEFVFRSADEVIRERLNFECEFRDRTGPDDTCALLIRDSVKEADRETVASPACDFSGPQYGRVLGDVGVLSCIGGQISALRHATDAAR